MNYETLYELLESNGVQLVAVSKTKPVSDIQLLYDKGHRDFGENRVQELLEKKDLLPKDIRWHFIGHLQKNKVKYLGNSVHLIHSLDNLKLARKMNAEASKDGTPFSALIQIKIAKEDSKYGYDWHTLKQDMPKILDMKNLFIKGVMGMGTLTDDDQVTAEEFKQLYSYFKELKQSFYPNDDSFKEVSMGMSGDYKIALEHGTTMVRVGSLLFGERSQQH